MQSSEDPNAWKQHIGEILLQIKGLKTWFEREQCALGADMCAQLDQIEVELQKLEAEAAPTEKALHASRMAAHIEALRARGDLAFDLLKSAPPRRSRQ